MDKAKKKQIKKIISWVLLAALVVTLAAMPLMAKSEAEANGPVATVTSGTVENGTITTALHGGGTLVTQGIEDVKLPQGVKITEFLVKNGDTVSEGTPLAAVDKVSVMTAITSVTETMEYLQGEIREAKNEKVSSTVAATAGGRVKKVFAQKGDSVQDVMLRDGALALLSLDGLMAVKIEEKTELSTGELVTVTFADNTEINGRVESNLDGVLIITMEDEGYSIGDAVTVTDKNGSLVGSGELYVHNAWSATAFSGTIQNVNAREESKISAGSTLFTLTDTDFQGKLEYLSGLHREYEQLMQDLFRMYNSGTIDAPCDGTISGIDKDSAHLLAAEEAPLEADLLTAEEPAWELVLLTSTVYEDGACGSETCPLKREHVVDACPRNVCDGTSDCPANPDKHDSACIFSCDHADTPDQCDGTGKHYTDCIKGCTSASKETDCNSTKHYPNCIHSCIPSDGSRDCPATGKHFPGCIEACIHADNAPDCPANTYHYPDCICCCIASDSGSKFCPSSKHKDRCFFAAMTYKAKVAIVTSVGSRELVVRWDASGQEYDVEKAGAGWKFVADPDFNVDLLVASGPKVTVSNPSAYKPGDVIFVITGYKGTNPEWTGISVFMRVSGNADLDIDLDLNGMLGGLSGMMPQMDLSALLGGFAGFGNFGFYATPPVEEDKLFDLEGSILMTVSPQETVALTIALDEQDIAKVAVGQTASVRVEALEGKTFEAVVTEVANRGSNSGGSSKFAVKLELSKAADMLDGMSASASLPLLTREDIPVIPVAALEELGAQTVVFTMLDEDGNPAGPVPVTVGISDGIHAEILSGLEAGDTFYYSYYEAPELDTGVEDRFTLT